MSDNIKQLHEVDQVSERLEELVRAIERTGMKVAVVCLELKGPHQPGFVLRPVEDPAAGADDIQAPDRNEELLH